jgi:hypothetical protein
MAARAVQEKIVAADPRLRECCLPVAALHVTVATLRLDSPADIDVARRMLDALQGDLSTLFPPPQRTVHVAGLECFRDRVLVAVLAPEDQARLATLSQRLIQRFQQAGLATPGNHDPVRHADSEEHKCKA